MLCYERADDVGFGVSGVVTRARGIRASLPDLNPADIPMMAPVRQEKVAYLLDPLDTSRRSRPIRAIDALLRTFGKPRDYAVDLPYIPPFLRKHDGLVMSLGQFMQFVGGQLMASGNVQIWPGMPVEQALIEDGRVRGIRLTDQGSDLPGMDIRADLTVVGDGPVGAVGQQLDREFGKPDGHDNREWAVGMKMVVDLPASTELQPGAVFHTFGYPEPEIFGFLYVHPDRVATVGIFVPSWFRSPARTSYRYLQHYMQHPYLWRHLRGGKLRSWGAKSLQESGRRAEPRLVGDGYARIGEGSGSTNVLTGSGVDEAWTTGTLLAEGVVELMRAGKPLTRFNLEAAYVDRRRHSWVEIEAQVAAKSARWIPPWDLARPAGNGPYRLDERNALHRRGAPARAFLAGLLSRQTVDGRNQPRHRHLPRQRRIQPRCADGILRLASDPLRRRTARLASGRAADGWQGPGARGPRRPRAVPRSGGLHAVRCQALRRDLLGQAFGSDHRRTAVLRS